MGAKTFWPIIVAAVLGWVFGIATNWLTMTMTRSAKKTDVARLLLSEVRFNDRRARAFATVYEQLASGKELKDEHGKPIPLDLTQAEILPGSFGFSIFDATLARQAHLDRDLMDTLHTFYRLLRQAEQFREASATDAAPQRRAAFVKNVFSSAAEAAKVARERDLLARLETMAK